MAKSIGNLRVIRTILLSISAICFLSSPLVGQSAPQEVNASKRIQKEKKTKTKTKNIRDFRKPSGLGLDVYSSLSLGISQSSAANIKNEPKKSGTHLGIQVVAALFHDNFGVDAGFGWLMNKMKPSNGPEQTTSLPFLSLTPMLRLSDLIYIGPTAQVAFGSFKTQYENKYKNAQTMFVGGKIKLSYSSEKFVYNGGLDYITEINDEGQDIQIVLLNFGFGFPAVKRYTLVTQQKTIEQQRTTIEQTVKKEFQTQTVKQTVALVFDSQVINFVTAKSDLGSPSALKLANLGRFLAANGDLWTKLVIEGHTDKRGTLEYNVKLSSDRANAVLNVLAANGVEASKLSAVGLAYNQPIDPGESELSLARNRRVEFKFDGVTDENKLRAGISESMK